MRSTFQKITTLFALFSMAFSPLSALAQRLPPGTLGCPVTTQQPYRSPSLTTVFAVGPDCTKRPIFNPDVYFSHFDDWNKVVFLEQYEMDAIPNNALNFLPWGPRREFGNGSLVKTTDDPRVYLIEDGEAHPIENEAAFTSLGFVFQQIEDVDPAVLSSFRKESVAIKGPSNIPPSTVFKYSDDPKVYVLKQENGVQTKQYVESYETLKAIARPDRIAILPREQTFPDKPKPIPSPASKPEPKPVPTPDTVVPSISFASPDTDATVSGTVTVKANVMDNAGVAYARFAMDSIVLKTDESAPYEVTIETGAYTNGSHVLSVLARDTSGNTASANRNFIISNQVPTTPVPTSTSMQDMTPPTVAFTAPASNASVSGSTLLQAEASDAGGIASVHFKIGSTDLATDTSAPYGASFDTSGYTNGSYTLTAIAKDVAGNIETASRTITIANVVAPPADTTAPSVAFTSPASGASVLGSISVAVSASDSVGISLVQFKIGSTILADDSDAPYGLTLDTTAFANGPYTLTAIAVDAAGNPGIVTRPITISNVIVPPPDTSAPSLVITSPASGATVSGTVTVDATASDNIGVSSVQFKVGSTVIGTDTSFPYSTSLNTGAFVDGSLTITAVVSDAAGNITSATRSVMVSNVIVPPPDVSAPTVSFSAPASGATVSGSMTVSATASDNVGVTSVQFKIGSTVIGTDTSSPYSATLDSVAYANGSQTLTVVATDAAGNAGTATRSITISNVAAPVDDEHPEGTFTSPAANATVNGTITISMTATDATGVASIQFKVGSTVIGTDTTSPYSATFDTTTVTNGVYVITATATDTLGNFAYFTRSITVANNAPPPPADVTAPTVSITSPLNGATVSGSTSLQATASDAVGVTSVVFRVNGSTIATDTSSPYSATLDTTSYSNGSYTLTAVATDAVGNQGTATASITISNQATPPPVQAALNNCYVNSGTVDNSAINLSLIPSRTSGVAPLSVFFDASNTTGGGAARPFHDLAYCWDFGDASAGSFTVSGKSKNRAYGPEAAHVFETPGTYTVNLNARDSQGRVATQSVQITVTDPTSVFSASNTVCLSGTGDFSGCPAGAKQVTNTSIGSMNTEIAGAGGKRRILIHRGESYTGGIQIDEAGPGLIGTYGSGAAPAINTTGRAFDFSDQDLVNDPYPTDWRIMDMDVDGQSNGNSLGVYIGGLTKNVLALRVKVKNAGGGFGSGDSIINYWNNNGNPGHDVIDGFAIQDSEARDCKGGQGRGLLGIASRRFSAQGNIFNNSEECEHVMRTFDLDRAVISNNDFGRTASGKSLLKLHNSGWAVSNHLFYQKPSERIVIADNMFRSGIEDWSIGFGPQNANFDERVQNVLFERNMFTPGTVTQIPLVIWAEDVTVRDNIFQNGNARDCVGIQRRGVEPPPARVNVFHNTCVGTNSAGTHIVSVLGNYSGMNVANNLVVGPTPRVSYDGELTRFTSSQNILQTNLATVFASGSPSTAVGYKLNANSPAIGAGSGAYATPWDYLMVPRAFGAGAPAPDVGAWDF